MTSLNARDLSEVTSHFWSSSEDKFLNFTWPFDFKSHSLVPSDLMKSDSCHAGISEINKASFQLISLFFQLEKTAGLAYSQLAHKGVDVAFEVGEEARHTIALANYLKSRFPTAQIDNRCEIALTNILANTKNTADLYEAINAIETVNLSIATALHHFGQDPLLVRLSSFIIADEYHHVAERGKFKVDGVTATSIIETVVDSLDSILIDLNQGEQIKNIKLKIVIGQFLSHFGYAEQSSPLNSFNYVERAAQIGTSTVEFLKGFSEHLEPFPDKQLTIDWMMAGLKRSPFWNHIN